MKGQENQNFPAFARVAKCLRYAGFEVVSPHELNEEAGIDPAKGQPPPSKVRELLAKDCEELLKCDGVAVMRGWQDSYGANAEVFLANASNMDVKPCMRWVYGPKLPPVVGLAGPKGVGKSTLAIDLADGKTALSSFAEPIRAMLKGVVPAEYLTELKNEEVPHMGVTGRSMLQTLGTEWGRQIVDRDLWVNFARQRVFALRGLEGDEAVDSIIFDDLRFENEANMVKELGGELWRVSRRGYEPPKDSHSSESGVPEDLVDRVIELNPEEDDGE